jgi:hypothetical protein
MYLDYSVSDLPGRSGSNCSRLLALVTHQSRAPAATNPVKPNHTVSLGWMIAATPIPVRAPAAVSRIARPNDTLLRKSHAILGASTAPKTAPPITPTIAKLRRSSRAVVPGTSPSWTQRAIDPSTAPHRMPRPLSPTVTATMRLNDAGFIKCGRDLTTRGSAAGPEAAADCKIVSRGGRSAPSAAIR